MPLAGQQIHQRCVHPGPLVLGTNPLNSPTPTADRDRTVSRRSEPSSRTALMGEQPNPWDLLQPQDATSRHRGAKPGRRFGLLGPIACYPRSTFYPLSDGTSTCYRRITKACFRTCSTRLSRSQAPLLPLHSTYDFHPYGGTLCAPPLHLGRPPPQSNYPPGTVQRPDSRRAVRSPIRQGWYLKVGSTAAAATAS